MEPPPTSGGAAARDYWERHRLVPVKETVRLGASEPLYIATIDDLAAYFRNYGDDVSEKVLSNRTLNLVGPWLGWAAVAAELVAIFDVGAGLAPYVTYSNVAPDVGASQRKFREAGLWAGATLVFGACALEFGNISDRSQRDAVLAFDQRLADRLGIHLHKAPWSGIEPGETTKAGGK